jgi:hypothetical protein
VTIDWSEIAVLISPLVPDRDAVILKILDISVSCNEPQKFVYDRLEVNLLGCKKREALAEVKSHLMTEYALRTCTGAVAFHGSVFADMTK